MSVPVGSVNDLVAVIQSHLAGSRTGGAARRRAVVRPAALQGKLAGQLSTLIASRVQAIAAQDPLRARKALRIFLEAVLVAHFGDALLTDPRFFQLVDEVHLALEAEPGCRELIASAMTQLLTQA